MDAEQICLLNGAAAFLERKLFRQALENSDMVRAVISCVMPVTGIGLKYVAYYCSCPLVYLTINLKPTDYGNLFCFISFHCECNNLITIQHIPQKHIVLNSVFLPVLVINKCGRVRLQNSC